MTPKKELANIFSNYSKDIFGLSYYYLNNKEDSKDVVMEVFEVFLKYKNRDKIRSVKAWLLESCRRICLAKIRKRVKQRNLAKDEFFAENFMENSESGHLYSEDIVEKLLDEINELDQNQRIVIHKFYFQKLSYNEIAQELDMPLKSVKSYIQNGRRNLKVRLKEVRNE